MSLELALTAALALGLGAILGFIHFKTLSLVIDRFAEGRLLAAAGLQAARLIALGGVLVAAAWFGALPLLACLAGLLAGRWLVLHREGAIT